jgi:hypothetical protein
MEDRSTQHQREAAEAASWPCAEGVPLDATNPEDQTTHAMDNIVTLMHFIESRGGDAIGALATARMHFEAEMILHEKGETENIA